MINRPTVSSTFLMLKTGPCWTLLSTSRMSWTPTLSYRWSCRMAVCGSCGLVINGTPKLGCETFLRDYYPGTIKVEPLANFPIEKDLVVDSEDFIKKLESVKPHIINAMEKPLEEGVNMQTPEQMGLYKQFSMCINCMLCYSALPADGSESTVCWSCGYRFGSSL